jgi:RES domain
MAETKLGLTHSGWSNNLPLLSAISFKNAPRLLQSRFSPADSAGAPLSRLANNASALAEISEVEKKADPLVQAENDLLPGISPHELVANVPFSRVINAAFTHTSEGGSRFNNKDRGTWYAAKSITTSQAEVIFHATARLAAMGEFNDDASYDEYLADFAGDYHDLRISPGFESVLAPDSYVQSQILAEALLAHGSLGVVYPSVRHAGGVCIACFRPSLVTHVRKGRTFRFRWRGKPKPAIELVGGARK